MPGTEPSPAADQSGQPVESNNPPLRERALLDFGWRFHFGHANDAARDFRHAERLVFDDNDWKPVNLPHERAIELPFKNDPALIRAEVLRKAQFVSAA